MNCNNRHALLLLLVVVAWGAAVTSAAGAERSDAEIRCPAIVGNTSRRVKTYKAKTFEATVAIPTLRTVQASERVMSFKCALTVNADSMPTKILLAATIDSAPEIPISFVKT